MLILGLIIGLIAFISFIFCIADHDKNYLGTLVSFLFIVIGIWLVVYDVSSPVEITKNKVFIATDYNNTTYSQPVKITSYNRNATKFWAIAKDAINFKYEVEILSEEAIKYWENN